MKPKKRQEQLEKRRQTWAKMKNGMDQKARSRYDNNGYKEPGSLKMY